MAEPMDLDVATPDISMGNYDQQNISPPRCPYRASGNPTVANNHFRPSQHPAFPHHPSLQPHHNHHFHSNHLPTPTWDYSVNHQPLQPPFTSTLNNRFLPPFDSPSQSGRARELAFFDNYHTHGDGRQQSHPSAQPQHNFQESRSIFHPPIPMNSSPSQNAGIPGENLAPPPRPLGLVDSSNYSTMSPRSESLNLQSQENGLPNSTSRENGQASFSSRQLPRPSFDQFLMQDRLMQGLPLPSFHGHSISTYPSDPYTSGLPPTNLPSRASLPTLPREFTRERLREDRRRPPMTDPHLPSYFTRTSSQPIVTGSGSGSQSSPPRGWQQVQRSTYLDFADSDDSGDDGGDERRYYARRYGTGPNGFNSRVSIPHLPTNEGELERARAARRSQQASVKFVASASALASFQKVEVSTLEGDDKNCIICYNEFGVMNPDGNVECPVRLPKCKHIFGDHCIKQWLKDSDSCPYCRDKLPSEPKQDPRITSTRAEYRRQFIRERRALAEEHSAQGYDGTAMAEALAGYPSMDSSLEAQHERTTAILRNHMNLPPNEMLAMIEHLQREAGDHPDQMDGPMNFSPRQIPDPDSSRGYRRRGTRHSLTRLNSQSTSRPNGSGTNAARVIRNHQQGTMRTAIQSSLSFDGGSTSQQRSITPHPAGLPSWSNYPRVGQPTSSGRPSSLPNERSPLGQASENTVPTIPGADFSNTNASPPMSFREDWTPRRIRNRTPSPPIPRTLPRFSRNSAPIGGSPNENGNGRPVSAEYINEMQAARQIPLFGRDQTQNQGDNENRSQGGVTGNVLMPPLRPQDTEFHQQFPGGYQGRHSGGNSHNRMPF